MNPSRSLYGLFIAACLTAACELPSAHADASLRDLRFRLGASGPALASPAQFVGRGPAIDLLFDSRGEAGSTVQLTIRGLGGIVLSSQSLPSAAPDWEPRRVSFEGRQACTSVIEGLRASWQGSRSDAERLAGARAGHQEYLLQVNARTVTLRSLQTLAEGLAWTGPIAEQRSGLAGHLKKMELLVTRARALPASDIESLKLLAQDMVQAAQAAQTLAQELSSGQPAACPPGLLLPTADGAAYDVTLSQGGFPALTGEFRFVTAPRVYLPALQRP